MSELRQNIITRDWVIIATERAKKPDDFAKINEKKIPIPNYSSTCPFCPGNEFTSAKEICRLDDGKKWKVRVVLNKYPALKFDGDSKRQIKGIYRSMSGTGIHEVVIEHSRHDMTTALLSKEEIKDILDIYYKRYIEIKKDKRLEAIIIFKNHGEGAGTSLLHPHSQIVATPIVPIQFRNRLEEAMRYQDDTGECVFCRTLKDEMASGDRIFFENSHFVAFIPYAALSPFHTWIFPKRHASSFDEINEEEIKDLSYVLKVVLSKIYIGLNNPDYNYNIRSVPIANPHTNNYFHWYFSIIPRVSKTAGFEIGSGMFINSVMPEQSAKFLREVEI